MYAKKEKKEKKSNSRLWNTEDGQLKDGNDDMNKLWFDSTWEYCVDTLLPYEAYSTHNIWEGRWMIEKRDPEYLASLVLI